MQKLLLLDYIDGSKKPKTEAWEFFTKVFSYAKHFKMIGPNKSSFQVHTKTLEEREFIDNVEMLMGKDESFLNLFASYASYINKKGEAYVFSNGLVNALSNTKMDIKGSYLPDKFCGYIELPNLRDQDNEVIQGIIVDIDTIEGKWYLRFAYVTNLKGLVMGHFFIHIDGNKPISELAESYKFREGRVGENGGVEYSTTQGIYHSFSSVIINAILYLTSQDADLIQSINEFSPKKSKSSGQKRIFTSKSFWSVGTTKEFHQINKPLKSNISVIGHWRFQPCGPKKQFVKFIYISPHTRNKKEAK